MEPFALSNNSQALGKVGSAWNILLIVNATSLTSLRFLMPLSTRHAFLKIVRHPPKNRDCSRGIETLLAVLSMDISSAAPSLQANAFAPAADSKRTAQHVVSAHPQMRPLSPVAVTSTPVPLSSKKGASHDHSRPSAQNACPVLRICVSRPQYCMDTSRWPGGPVGTLWRRSDHCLRFAGHQQGLCCPGTGNQRPPDLSDRLAHL